jgi:hypothetical protein
VPYNKEEKKERHNVASLKYYYNFAHLVIIDFYMGGLQKLGGISVFPQ